MVSFGCLPPSGSDRSHRVRANPCIVARYTTNFLSSTTCSTPIDKLKIFNFLTLTIIPNKFGALGSFLKNLMNETVNKYCLVIRTDIGDLHTVPIWHGLKEFNIKAGAWQVRIDNEYLEESLQIELTGLTPTQVDEFAAFLTTGRTQVLVAVSRVET